MCIVGPMCIYYYAEEIKLCIVFLFIGAIVAISFWIHYEIRTASDLKDKFWCDLIAKRSIGNRGCIE